MADSRSEPIASDHILGSDPVHHKWDRTLRPVAVIESGETVRFDLPMAGRGQVERGAGFERANIDDDTVYNLVGPVFVSGARPGDTLEIEILRLSPGDWGWCGIFPGEGLLPEDFPDPYLKTVELTDASTAKLAPGVEIPLDPFLGTMGTHPGEADVIDVFPPHRGGGNMDARYLRQGATLWLPIWCEGGLFSCGDPHAVQGDGEVCVTGLECDMQAVLRFHLRKWTIASPRFFTPGPLAYVTDERGHLGTMGIDADLMRGAKTAVREMIEILVARWGLTREDAYIACSLAGDLKILEIVDAGVWNIGFTVPLAVFS